MASPRSVDVETSHAGIQSALDMAVATAQLPDPVLKFGVDNVPVNGSGRSFIGTDFVTMRSVSVIQEPAWIEKRHAHAKHFNTEVSTVETQHVTALAAARRSTT